MKHRFITNFLLLTIFQSTYVYSYYSDFESDGIYFDKIQQKLDTEVEISSTYLSSDAESVQQAAKDYVEAKLSQNLFKALRILAEKELSDEEIVVRPRQSEEEEEGEEETGESTTVAGGSTTSGSITIVPQIANIVKAIFGGNSINITSYVQQATKFLPPSVGNQFLGVVKLLAHNPSARWTTTTTTTTTTPPPTTPTTTTRPSVFVVIRNRINETLSKLIPNDTITATTAAPAKVIVLPAGASSSSSTTPVTDTSNSTATSKPGATTSKSKSTTEDDEDEEDEDNARQLKIPDLSQGISALGSLLSGGLGRTPRPATMAATTESASGFEPESTSSSGFDLREVGAGIRAGLGDLIKVAPDLFKGVREAISLISGIQGLLGSFGN